MIYHMLVVNCGQQIRNLVRWGDQNDVMTHWGVLGRRSLAPWPIQSHDISTAGDSRLLLLETSAFLAVNHIISAPSIINLR